jgi:ABC-type antimicrobial peptide transport system permease subunit
MTSSNHHPPKWIKRFFEWYCSPEVAEDFLGDMDELFYQNLNLFSPAKAKRKYLFQSLALLFSYAVRQRKKNVKGAPESYHSFAMYHSYSKIAFRSLAKQKIFAVINIICLAVGMSIGLIALAAWIDVLQVDNFHSKKENIYRVTTELDDQNDKRVFASSHMFVADKLKNEGAGVDDVVFLNKTFKSEIVLSPAVSIPIANGYYVSPAFLRMFDFPLLTGSKATALAKPFSVLLSQEMAEKLYRDGQALGKIIEIKGLGEFEVTGVVATHSRSHFYFDAITSLETLATLEQQGKVERMMQSTEPRTSNYTYVLLNPEANTDGVQAVLNASAAHIEKSGKTKIGVRYELQQLNDIAMSDLNNEVGLSWGYVSLIVFFFLSILVLLPACFNYANISIARAMKRSKEIGLRKVSGGESKHIFIQMVMETIIISVIALGGSLLIFSAIKNQFLQMVVNGHRTFSLELTPLTLLVFLLFAILTGFVAGVLPASYFSKLNPIETLRNSSASGKISKISIRKGLIVVQFALSLFFILSVAIVVKQYRYALNYDLGFEKENILDIQLKGVDERLFRAELSKIKDVQRVSMSSSIAGNWGSSGTYLMINDGRDSLELYQMFVDEKYISNLEITMLAGAGFQEGDENSVIVNEEFLTKNQIATPHDALGMSYECEGKSVTITGVVANFNFMPLAERIHPFIFRNRVGAYNFANVKLQTNDIQRTISEIELAWNKLTEQKFEAQFLKHELDDSLTSYRSMVKIFGSLGLLAITISSLGLLAVVISSAESRMREMGIRKVFGASSSNLVMVMGSGFIKLIGIAIAIATPLTYFIFDSVFLKIFFYRAEIGLFELATGIGFLLGLVAIIIGSQTFRVARVNPVETLKVD